MCSPENLERLGYYLRGTCESIHKALECLEIEDNGEDWEDELLNVNTEECLGCGWWFESCELLDEEDNPGYCDQCRAEKEEDES